MRPPAASVCEPRPVVSVLDDGSDGVTCSTRTKPLVPTERSSAAEPLLMLTSPRGAEITPWCSICDWLKSTMEPPSVTWICGWRGSLAVCTVIAPAPPESAMSLPSTRLW